MINAEKPENVLIIGGSSSIGLPIIKLFNSKKKNIIFSFNKNDNKKNIDSNIKSLKLNLEDQKSINFFIGNVKKLFNKLDIIIFISGVLPGKKLSSYQSHEIEKVMKINFFSQACIFKNLLPLIYENTRVLMISSISAQKGSYDPIYAASKGAILSFVKSVLNQIPKGARVNAIAPSLIEDTTMYMNMGSSIIENHKNQIQSGQLLKIDDLAKIIVDLCESHWKHLNGSCIDINGGQYVR